MTKQEWLQKCWIPLDKRLPPEEKWIAIWNPELGHPMIGYSTILLVQIRQRKKKDFPLHKQEKGTGYWATHWMFLPSPNKE